MLERGHVIAHLAQVGRTALHSGASFGREQLAQCRLSSLDAAGEHSLAAHNRAGYYRIQPKPQIRILRLTQRILTDARHRGGDEGLARAKESTSARTLPRGSSPRAARPSCERP